MLTRSRSFYLPMRKIVRHNLDLANLTSANRVQLAQLEAFAACSGTSVDIVVPAIGNVLAIQVERSAAHSLIAGSRVGARHVIDAGHSVSSHCIEERVLRAYTSRNRDAGTRDATQRLKPGNLGSRTNGCGSGADFHPGR